MPVIDEILEEEFVSEDKVEGGFGANETKQPFLVRVPRQWVVHLNLEKEIAWKLILFFAPVKMESLAVL